METEHEVMAELRFAGSTPAGTAPEIQRLLRLATQLFDAPWAVAVLAEADVPQRFSICGVRDSDPLLGALGGSSHFLGLHAQALATGAPEVLLDLHLNAPDAELAALGVRTALGVPLTATQGARLGTLWILGSEPRAWLPADEERLSNVGEILATQVTLQREHRTANLGERKRAEVRATAFQSLGQRLNTAATPREAAEIIIEVADQLLGWDACWLDLCDFDTGQSHSILLMDLVAGERQEVPSVDIRLTDDSLAWRAAQEGAFRILHTDESLQQSLEKYVSFGDLTRPSASLLCAPIRCGSRTFGALSVQSYTLNAFTETDLETLQALADYCSGALQRTLVETERRELQTQLLQSQKMEAVGRLAGGVAHDFNNMLAVINGYSELLLMRGNADSPDRGPIEEILKAGQRAAALTRQLLAFSRKQITAPQVLDLAEAVLQTQKMLRRLIGNDVELVTLPEPDAGRVLADPAQIDQLLVNLALNAREAMPRGGKLTLRVRRAEFTRPQAGYPDTVPAGSYVLLEVGDTGCGIAPETLHHVFEPFFTTKPVGQGSGLGLATVHGTLKQNGGFIQVQSELGNGACFRLYFPALPAENEPPQTPQSTASRQGTETILLVEDEEMLRGLLKSVLESKGYTVLQAAHGEEAIRRCQEHGETIQLLLTDVVMPVKGGRELAEWVQIQYPHIRLLYMSAYTEDAVFRHGVEADGAHFIQKPFATAALAQKVREVLDGTKDR
jgi:signal transduction histidine kinase/ActR/RegA family two-component response regulator